MRGRQQPRPGRGAGRAGRHSRRQEQPATRAIKSFQRTLRGDAPGGDPRAARRAARHRRRDGSRSFTLGRPVAPTGRRRARGSPTEPAPQSVACPPVRPGKAIRVTAAGSQRGRQRSPARDSRRRRFDGGHACSTASGSRRRGLAPENARSSGGRPQRAAFGALLCLTDGSLQGGPGWSEQFALGRLPCSAA